MLTLDFSTLFLAFGAFSGFLIAPVLILSQRGNLKANRLLGVAILVTSFILLNPVLLQILEPEEHTYMIRSTSSLFFCMGPLAYLYVRACTEKDFHFQTRRWLHFVPVLLDLAYNLRFYLAGPEVKMTYFQEMQDGNPQIEMLILSGLKVLHLFVYYLLAEREIRHYYRDLKEVKANIDPDYGTWLRIFTLGLLLIVIMGLLLVLTKFNNTLEVGTFLSFFLLVMCVQVTALIKPEIFHGFPEPRRVEGSRENIRSILTEEEKQRLYDRLLAYMDEVRPYENPDISLDSLADQIKTHRNYLSLVINEKGGRNFMDFINSYRVKDLQKRLHDPKYENWTILAVAFDVGFNSKSAFYTAFKKITGQTPSEYRKSIEMEARA